MGRTGKGSEVGEGTGTRRAPLVAAGCLSACGPPQTGFTVAGGAFDCICWVAL